MTVPWLQWNVWVVAQRFDGVDTGVRNAMTEGRARRFIV
jgi:hypothetical protein